MEFGLDEHPDGKLDLRLNWHSGIYGQPQVIVIPLKDRREAHLYIKQMGSITNLWSQGKLKEYVTRTTDEDERARKKPRATPKTPGIKEGDSRKPPRKGGGRRVRPRRGSTSGARR